MLAISQSGENYYYLNWIPSLAISQSGENYYYLNWVPSEAGPMVTQHGFIKKELENPDKIDEHYYEVLDEIFSNVR